MIKVSFIPISKPTIKKRVRLVQSSISRLTLSLPEPFERRNEDLQVYLDNSIYSTLSKLIMTSASR